MLIVFINSLFVKISCLSSSNQTFVINFDYLFTSVYLAWVINGQYPEHQLSKRSKNICSLLNWIKGLIQGHLFLKPQVNSGILSGVNYLLNPVYLLN